MPTFSTFSDKGSRFLKENRIQWFQQRTNNWIMLLEKRLVDLELKPPREKRWNVRRCNLVSQKKKIFTHCMYSCFSDCVSADTVYKSHGLQVNHLTMTYGLLTLFSLEKNTEIVPFIPEVNTFGQMLV